MWRSPQRQESKSRPEMDESAHSLLTDDTYRDRARWPDTMSMTRVSTRVRTRIGTSFCEHDGATHHVLGHFRGHIPERALTKTESADLGFHERSLSLVRAVGRCRSWSVGGTLPIRARRPYAPRNTCFFQDDHTLCGTSHAKESVVRNSSRTTDPMLPSRFCSHLPLSRLFVSTDRPPDHTSAQRKCCRYTFS